MSKTVREIIEDYIADPDNSHEGSLSPVGIDELAHEIEANFISGRKWENGTIQVTELPALRRRGAAIQIEELPTKLTVGYIHKEDV